MDFGRFPEWNPFMTEVVGTPAEGERLHVRMQLPGRTPVRFRPTVLRVERGREFRWLGHTFAAGIFDGEHVLELADLGEQTRFVQREEFRGFLVPLMLLILGEGTERGFVAMNEALKERAERLAGS